MGFVQAQVSETCHLFRSHYLRIASSVVPLGRVAVHKALLTSNDRVLIATLS